MLSQFLSTFLGYVPELLPFFLLASAVGAGLQTYARNVLSRGLISRLYSPLATAIAGALVPVYSCSYVLLSLIIASFLRVLSSESVVVRLSEGQVLTFMFASLGACVPIVTALVSFFPKKVVAYYALPWFPFSALAGFGLDRV